MRQQKLKDANVPFTVTVMFKDTPQYLHAKAWRIIRAVVKGKELLPEYVRQSMEDSLARHCGGEAPQKL